MKISRLQPLLRGVAVAVCLAHAWHSPAQSTDDRVDPSGPYRSKMRILKPDDATAPDIALRDDRDDGYSSALNQRAAGYLAARNGDLQAAIVALSEALATDALAPLAQQALRQDLIALWANANDDPSLAEAHARWRAAGAAFDAASSIRAARAYARLMRFDAALAAVDSALAAQPSPPLSWPRLKVFVLARLERYDEAAALAARLLTLGSRDADDWRNLVELQRAAGDPHAAVATAEMAFERGVLTNTEDTLKLARLYLATGLPDHAAVLLRSQRDSGALAPVADHVRLLVRAELQAGNETAALAPSRTLAALTDSAADWLALARLEFDLGYARAAAQSARTALRGDLGSARGRALLLMGESLLADGQTRSARRAFEQASEVGGVYREAQAYLARMAQTEPDAAPDPVRETPGDVDAGVVTDARGVPTGAIEIERKFVPRLRFFYLSETLNAAQLPQKLRRMTRRVRTAVRRERLTVAGPLQWWVDATTLSESADFEVQLGVPVRTRVPPRGDFRNRDLPPMECAYRVYDGDPAGLGPAWARFAADLAAAGLATGRDTRTVILNINQDAGTARFELQIELRERP